MSLNQFGAVMTFAIELENNIAKFYKQASEENAEFKEEFQKRAKDSLSRMKKLEKSRRENVTEIILEPIEGLDQNNYVLNLESNHIDGAQKIEEIVTQFYKDVYEKINVFESKRVLKKCYMQHKALSNDNK